jgi:hypothetical protein
MNKTAIDLSVGAGAVSIPWWIQLTSGLELLIAIGGVFLISVRLAMAFREWKQK